MTINDYAISQELGDVVLKLLTNSNFKNYIKDIQNFNTVINESSKEKILFQVFDNPLLWATVIYNYGLKNNCKTKLDKMLIKTQNFKSSKVSTVIELSSNFFVELCCPTTKK